MSLLLSLFFLRYGSELEGRLVLQISIGDGYPFLPGVLWNCLLYFSNEKYYSKDGFSPLLSYIRTIPQPAHTSVRYFWRCLHDVLRRSWAKSWFYCFSFYLFSLFYIITCVRTYKRGLNADGNKLTALFSSTEYVLIKKYF